eukprot:s886_g21.t1
MAAFFLSCFILFLRDLLNLESEEEEEKRARRRLFLGLKLDEEEEEEEEEEEAENAMLPCKYAPALGSTQTSLLCYNSISNISLESSRLCCSGCRDTRNHLVIVVAED